MNIVVVNFGADASETEASPSTILYVLSVLV